MKRIVFSLLMSFSLLEGGALTRQEATGFLYSIISLPDSADYSRKFYTDNIEASFKAREEMPWGKSVPDREFLHFVIPIRVNNENLDMSRLSFYDELKDRVKGLSMRDAILEVNHWCHEKVTYRPSDARTSSPLSSVSQAIGRCGEESTFTVAALRSVGIPARQIYTPRWAHTDDNHAWVEAWADGQWYFLGACEPEPVLNLAWFNEPASRGLLMSTNVAGQYDGPEEVLLQEPLTTRINVTSNYAPTGTLPVKVIHMDGTPAPGVKVNFCIYNYAEYYPAVTKISGTEGEVALTAGLGDMIVWATDGERFGFAKGHVGQEPPVVVVLDKDSSWCGSSEFDIIPPAQRHSLPEVNESLRFENSLRTQREDSIRNAYTSSFATPERARALAEELSLDYDSILQILTESRGNHQHISRLLSTLSAEERNLATALLLNVTEKDRRDIPMSVVIDNISNVKPLEDITPKITEEIYARYILSPRIENEGLRPWRKALATEKELLEIGNNPEGLVAWIDGNITLAPEENPLKLRMSPIAVMSTRKADPLSRNIFFVAAARTLGIPSRIDPVTGTPQYLAGETWKNARFKDMVADSNTIAKTGRLIISYKPEGYIVDPKYYSQFSLSMIIDGVPRQLEFDENGTVSSIFSSPIELEAGQYILTSGQRLANGGVLAQSEIFTLNPGETIDKELIIRGDDRAVSVIGSLNAENIYHDLSLDTDKSILSTTGRGYYVLGLISPNHEPSTHALNDLSAMTQRLEDTGVKIMLLFDNKESASRFNRDAFSNLPSNIVFGIDNGSVSRKEILESLHLEQAVDPVFVIADTFNRVVWVSTGYTIGIADPILSTLTTIRQ